MMSSRVLYYLRAPLNNNNIKKKINNKNLYDGKQVVEIVKSVLNDIRMEETLRTEYGIGSNLNELLIYNETIINKVKQKIK